MVSSEIMNTMFPPGKCDHAADNHETEAARPERQTGLFRPRYILGFYRTRIDENNSKQERING